ncbi:helicase-associated domain-containing protein [Nonomuraea rhizosphaerae]|uniref:helicase-associated domain-containing protein n=1 Tax=Nonomuraea rhizosphaerae TaxID=2665663 RepID=UPI001C5F16DD|nr:helicase-associated domain-containing protein [Nonomuraea rhizosphaerae]
MLRDALKDWLATRTPAQLSLLADRGALRSRGREPSPDEYVHLLQQEQVIARLAGFCTLPDLQALRAISWLSAQRDGPFPEDRWAAGDRAVARTEVVGLLAGHDETLRAEAEATLDRLADQALLHPPHGEQIVAPSYVHRYLTTDLGLGRPVARLISQYLNAPEVHRLATALGLDQAPSREAAQRNVVAYLTDPARLRTLLDKAPASAKELLDRLAYEGPGVEVRCFHLAGSYGSNKYTFFAGGSGHAGADWLAARGLLLPAGVVGTAELPLEVAMAVRGEVRAPFTPHPPEPGDLPRAERVEPTAQAAVNTLTWQLERLLAGCVAQPLPVRRSGGVALRDLKRLAKEITSPELLLELCFRAGLLGVVPEPAANRREGPSYVVLPTKGYDKWVAREPAQRLVPIIAAWVVCRSIPLWDPAPAQGTAAYVRDALGRSDDPDAVSLRYALLEALAAAPGLRVADAAPYLVAAATWHRPVRMPTDPATGAQRIDATLREATQLGVLADGCLTELGHTVLALLRTGQAWKSPHTTLTPALAAMLPAPRSTARFQTDLTAVVSGVPGATLAALLSTVGVRESEGHAVVWRITQASVRSALDAGHTAATLLDRLRAVAESGLPQPLEYLVNDVGRAHGRMRVVRSGCCVRSDDEALLTELVHARPLRHLGLRQIAPTVLISGKPEGETMEALRAAGYAPALEAETGATLVEQPGARRAP